MLTQKNRGILCIILSAFSFALMGMFLKLAGDLPSIEKSFFRNLVAAVIAFVMLLRSRESVQIQKRNLHWFILRSLFGTLGIFVCPAWANSNGCKSRTCPDSGKCIAEQQGCLS